MIGLANLGPIFFTGRLSVAFSRCGLNDIRGYTKPCVSEQVILSTRLELRETFFRACPPGVAGIRKTNGPADLVRCRDYNCKMGKNRMGFVTFLLESENFEFQRGPGTKFTRLTGKHPLTWLPRLTKK